ncbi:MFS transporter [Peribacillus frigoritolerans]|uniref:MFS transporter n=1 Tax=Peribacillus castrilensis TaxID=2897690 RepID=A0AAW9NHZ8_9BACI|nr:MFS transporter [Peribacillus castrilensis]
MHNNKLWNGNFLLLCFSNFFMFTSFYMLLPTLPVYLVEHLDGTERQVGLIIAFFTTAQIFARPLAGKWLDEIGRKKVFLYARIAFFVLMFLYLNIPGLLLFFLLRFIHGFSFGIATTAAGTMAADIVPSELRSEGMGYYGAFVSLALVIGPSLGLWIVNSGNFNILFIFCCILGGISAFLGNLIKVDDPTLKKGGNQKRSLIEKLVEPKVMLICIVAVMILSVYGGIVSFISLYAKELKMVEASGYFFTVYSLVLLVIRPITGKISDKYGAYFVIYPGMLLCIVGTVVLSQSNTLTIFLLSAFLISLGLGSIQPSLQALVINAVPSERRGAATATYLMSIDLGIAGGAFVLGIIANYIGYSGMFLSSSLFVLVGLIFYGLYQFRQVKIRNEQLHQETKNSITTEIE